MIIWNGVMIYPYEIHDWIWLEVKIKSWLKLWIIRIEAMIDRNLGHD